MKLFGFMNKSNNPMNELVEDLCFGITLYRKAAFQSHDEHISSILLGLADFRESVLAQLRPYASVWEGSPVSRQKAAEEQNKKVMAMIVEIEADRDWFMVRQVEAKTVELIESVQASSSNTLITYLLESLGKEMDVKLDDLLLAKEEEKKTLEQAVA